VTGVLAASGIQYMFRNRGAFETIDDGGIDVNALLEDTPEGQKKRRQKEQCVGLQARQVLNALQKVRNVTFLSINTLC
jgi:hypothetical protein